VATPIDISALITQIMNLVVQLLPMILIITVLLTVFKSFK